MDNIAIFKENLSLIDSNGQLNKATKEAIKATGVIGEGFVSKRNPYYAKAAVTFAEGLTLQAAELFSKQGKKTAVLNFANPVEAGGGVWRGANAQEEYLCRASNLYPCLSSDRAKPYYDYHRSLLMRNDRRAFSTSDRIIYSEGVTVFRVDTRQGQAYTEDWYQIDVITCAAPWFKSKDDLPLDEQLYHIFDSRIRNILESAIEHEAEALVLGAFGCGAFHNPPEIVSKAFRNILLEDRYRHAFDHVVFAVKRTGSFCENIECFEIEFSRFPERAEFSSERNKRRFFE